MFTVKENLNDFLLTGQIHLSKKDYGFFSNLKYLVKDTGQITTNQSNLFDKLLVKYQRQLNKQGYDTEHLCKLPWQVSIVESKKEYLEARLFFAEGKICFKLPFNNQFIKFFRNLDNNTFEWNKSHKRYESDFSTYSLKLALHSLQKFYKEIVFDDTVKKLFIELEKYKNIKVWQPTLVKSNGNFYIAGITESLSANLKDVSLSDDPKLLFLLSRYGIKIDDEIVQEDKFKKFASSFYVTMDLDDLPKMMLYLKLLDITQITLTSEMIYSKEISKEVKEKINEYGLECHPFAKNSGDSVLLQYARNGYSIKKNKNIVKCITLTNSRPIHVR